MVFNSSTFIIFILMVFVFYYLIPKRYQWIVLLVATMAFYVYSAGYLIIYLLATTTITFFTGVFLDKLNEKQKDLSVLGDKEISRKERALSIIKIKKNKKRILSIALVTTFGILAFVKYSNFISKNISSLLAQFTIDFTIPSFNLLLPMGISFYMFQSVGYIIDIYRRKIDAEKNIAKLALFVSFFPQIVQGPISRYDEVADQLYESHDFEYIRTKFGLQLILWGLFKKMVIADRVIPTVDFIFNNYKEYNGFIIFFGVALYSLQIYCDFSGGINIARGVAQIFGIVLPENFRCPFFATSIEDFWRRWHITLGSWMRDYVLYPLSLSKIFYKLGRLSRKIFGKYFGKLFPTFLAIMITFLLVGIWHGPDWKFIAYGVYNGFLIIIGILTGPVINKTMKKLAVKPNNFSWRLLNIAGTFFLITIGRYFSRASNLWTAQNMIRWTFLKINPWVLFDGTIFNLGLDSKDISILIISIAVLFLVDIFQEKGIHLRQKISEQNLVFRWSIYIVAIFAILIFGIYGIGYEGSDFIYKGF